MGGVQPSKLAESSTVTGLSYLEDGQFAKIYKVSFNSNTLQKSTRSDSCLRFLNGFPDLGAVEA